MAVCLRHVEALYFKFVHEDDAEEHSGSGKVGAGRANTVVIVVLITPFAGCEAIFHPADARLAGVGNGSSNDFCLSGEDEN